MEKLDKEELQDDNEPDSIIKKLITGVIGIGLAILVVSYLFVAFPIGPIIEGYFEADVVKDKVLEGDGITIEFKGKTWEKLQGFYKDELALEFAACLQGGREGNRYFINALYQPKMYAQAYNHVRFEPCSEETIVLLHSHPFKRCIASEQDIRTLADSKQVNSDIIMAVMCEGDRISIYR